MQILGNLLVLEKQADPARAFKRHLSAAGWNVSIVDGASRAKELLVEMRFDVALVSADATADPLSFIEHARKLTHPPEVLLAASRLDAALAARAVRAGAVDAFAKPVEPADLLMAVNRAVGIAMPAERDSRRDPLDAADGIRGETRSIRAIRHQVRRLGKLPAISVVIEGEAGSGKKLIARALSELRSPGAPVLSLDCRIRPVHELAALLFGDGARPGLLREAAEGTLILANVFELPDALQPRLSAVFQQWGTRRVEPVVDGTLPKSIIGLTERPFRKSQETFDADSYYRIAGFVIRVPPLRDRVADVAILATHFLSAMKHAPRLTAGALQALRDESHLLSVRELKSLVEKAAAQCGKPTLTDDDVYQAASGTSSGVRVQRQRTDSINEETSLGNLGRHMIEDAMARSDGNVSEAARLLGIPRSTLRDKLKRYGMR